jgi:hypothetical protein
MDNALGLDRLTATHGGGFQEHRDVTSTADPVETPQPSDSSSENENIDAHRTVLKP